MITEEEQGILDQFADTTEEQAAVETKDAGAKEEVQAKKEPEVEVKEEKSPVGKKEDKASINVDGVEVTEEDIRRLTQAELNEESDIELAVKQWDLTAEDMALMRDIKKGDVSAIAELLRKHSDKLEDLDLDKETGYRADTTIEKQTKIDKILNTVIKDEAWTDGYKGMVEYAPEGFMEHLASDVEVFQKVVELGKTEVGKEAFQKASIRTRIKGTDFGTNLFNVVAEMHEGKKKDNVKSEKKENMDKLKQQISLGNSLSGGGTRSKSIDDMNDEELAAHEAEVFSRYQ